MDLTWLALAVGVLAMLVVVVLAWSILREPVGPRQMEKVAGFIEEGAKAFIKRQYGTIGVFVALSLIPLAIFFRDVRVAVAFVFGAALSLLAAYIGLRVAVKAGVRTANASRASKTMPNNIKT